MPRHVIVSCELCDWTVCGAVVTSAMEAAIRGHMQGEHKGDLPPPGFGGRPRLADILRHFRIGADPHEGRPGR